MLLRPNPKSPNGFNVCLQILTGTSKTTASGFIFSEEEGGGWLCPVSADIARTPKSFFCGLARRQGRKFEEPGDTLTNDDEDSIAGQVDTWTTDFPNIFLVSAQLQPNKSFDNASQQGYG
jgi:hypothetical protein